MPSSHTYVQPIYRILRKIGELKEGDVKKEAKDYRLLKSYVITTSIQDTCTPVD